MTKEKIRGYLRISVNDLINDPLARRELAKLFLKECIKKKDTKPLDQIESEFCDMLQHFAD